MATHSCSNHSTHSHSGSSLVLRWVLIITALYMIAEIVGGLWSGSLALIADAGHMVTDVAAAALGLFASWIARMPADDRKTYGYHRAEILAALANGFVLITMACGVAYAGWTRMSTYSSINGPIMSAVACGGLMINLACLWLIHRGGENDLNLHGVWLHVMGDALGSVAALVAGALVWRFQWWQADAVASILIAILILVGAVQLVLRCVDVLLESVPHGVQLNDIRSALLMVPGVCAVHDLHVWSVSNGVSTLSAHLCVAQTANHTDVLEGVHEILLERFKIHHTTVQLEPPSFAHAPLHP